MLDWIRSTIDATGPLGVALLMRLENVFPPIPSELVMPLAGSVAGGLVDLAIAVAAGSAGSLAGALFWYAFTRRVGADRLKRWARDNGRWLTVPPADIDHASGWFDRHGNAAVLLGRLVPAIRTLISLPAGIVAMPLARFLLLSSVGTVARNAARASAGYALRSEYEAVSDWVNPTGTAVLTGLAGLYGLRGRGES